MSKPRTTSAPFDRGQSLSPWLACAANAIPLWVTLVALLHWSLGPLTPPALLAAYVAVLALWIAVFKPWAAQRAG
ncbi:hypothetical protein EIB18_17695 [Caulobacter vibrioides]|uniref:Uncharacterized protein n=1 Tax=Caulobacter vibrioides (strain NA1000 / CB15N) TaxID=565050 RepID=A0A0H3CBM4_CAUVN|nr:hypothetical protein [Caulobacter vibrioides]YP_002518824.2 hypothetical protein CCNA_03451 [Caulobacter vibrioides NA1000]ACL96916.2 hypothetical protein CCNA_03451 [Caulobacter vibrioides NA1000]ATC26216.1 hypothetical protein CA608_17595 [Caulobacter vibrioides]AZH14357.1 hypothetical protein EIB18_17695 [Caulobacter vibrioides]PLR10928.1 hypothetical protein CVUC_12685 [Caulobacter vibrioides]QXZ51691.1 hypothetical protein KZH45_17690 [Caulobacter vibrioides]